MKRLLLSVAALGLFLGVTGRAKADYKFRTIDPPGSTRPQAQGINGRGDIVGVYEEANHIIHHGFLLIDGHYSSFDVPVPGTTWSQGSGINDFGEIVGRYIAGGIQHGYLRLRDGNNYVLLPDPPGGTSPQPYALNSARDIVGYYVDVTDGATRGFLLSGDSYTTIDPPGSTFTLAQGINNFGIVVGVYEDVAGRRHGFVRLRGGRFVYPPDVPGSSLTSFIGINDLGQISGTHIDACDIRHGLVLEYGQYTTLLDPPDAVNNVYASGINAAGEIVGRYDDAAGDTHAFLATPIPEPATPHP